MMLSIENVSAAYLIYLSQVQINLHKVHIIVTVDKTEKFIYIYGLN